MGNYRSKKFLDHGTSATLELDQAFFQITNGWSRGYCRRLFIFKTRPRWQEEVPEQARYHYWTRSFKMRLKTRSEKMALYYWKCAHCNDIELFSSLAICVSYDL